MIALSLIPDAALALVGVVLAALVRVVWTLHGRLSRLEEASYQITLEEE